MSDALGEPASEPGVIEFDCRDCGLHVFDFGRTKAPDPPLCGLCAWLDEFVPDPAEQAAIRARSL